MIPTASYCRESPRCCRFRKCSSIGRAQLFNPTCTRHPGCHPDIDVFLTQKKKRTPRQMSHTVIPPTCGHPCTAPRRVASHRPWRSAQAPSRTMRRRQLTRWPTFSSIVVSTRGPLGTACCEVRLALWSVLASSWSARLPHSTFAITPDHTAQHDVLCQLNCAEKRGRSSARTPMCLGSWAGTLTFLCTKPGAVPTCREEPGILRTMPPRSEVAAAIYRAEAS